MDLLTKTFSRRTAAKNFLAAGAAGLVVASEAEAAQVHMENALKALNNAASQLQAAVDDKAGHRAKAIQLVSQAINQVQQGIQAGAK
jgi:ribosomal protein S20